VLAIYIGIGDLDLYLVGIVVGAKFSFSYLSANALLLARESFKP
jgi:hypothetical protein